MEPSDQKAQVLPDRDRALLDQLLSDSNLYRSSRNFRELLDFTVRLRNMAPFNAMLLQIQKPGLSYAASAYDWRHGFKRTIKEKSRHFPMENRLPMRNPVPFDDFASSRMVIKLSEEKRESKVIWYEAIW